MSNQSCCHNAKCAKELSGNFVVMNYGAIGDGYHATGDAFFKDRKSVV